MKIADSLTAKIGPLPVWAWGVGIGLTFNVGRAVYRRTTSADEPETAADGTDSGDAVPLASVGEPLAGVPVSGGYAPAVGNPAGWDGPPADGIDAPDGPAAPTDNEAWRALAVEQLVAAGFHPIQVDEALKRYFAGTGLTPQDQAIVSMAIRRLGVPPGGAPPITSVAGPPPPDPGRGPGTNKPPAQPATPPEAPATPTPVVGTVTIKSGDTLWGLVQKRYGTATRAKVDEIAALNGLSWNAAHTQVSPWRIGQTVKLP